MYATSETAANKRFLKEQPVRVTYKTKKAYNQTAALNTKDSLDRILNVCQRTTVSLRFSEIQLRNLY